MDTYTARISPQVASGDQCIPIDPPGAAEWDASEYLNGLSSTEGLMSDADEAYGEEVLDINDLMAQDPNAPEWVQRHVQDHPFDIYVRRDDLDPADEESRLYDVTISRVEHIVYRVSAGSPEKAEENAYDGEEIGSWLKDVQTVSVEAVQA